MRKLQTATFFNNNTKNLTAEEWLPIILSVKTHENPVLLKKAIELVQTFGTNQHTPLHLSCFQQGLCIAEILTALPFDIEILAAAICYPAVQYANLTLDHIKEQLSPNVAKLVEGTKRMEAIGNLLEKKNSQRLSAN